MQGPDLTKVSTEVFKAKSRAEIVELALQSRASASGKSRGLCQENQSESQEGTQFACTTRKLSTMLNHVLDLLDYMLDLSDYAGMSNVLSNLCIA